MGSGLSDRVAIIGGKMVGRDHFPDPVVVATPGSILPTPNFPVGFSLSDFMMIFYVVRRWKLQVFMEWNDALGSGHTGSAIVEIEPHWEDGSDGGSILEREAQIVLRRDFYANWDDVDGWTSTETEIISDNRTGDPLTSFGFEFEYVHPYFQDDSFWCESTAIGIAGSFTAASHLSNPETVGQFTLYGGVETPIYAPSLTPTTLFGITSCNIILQPSNLYWQYATKEGNPVWDELTGGQVNDPLS